LFSIGESLEWGNVKAAEIETRKGVKVDSARVLKGKGPLASIFGLYGAI